MINYTLRTSYFNTLCHKPFLILLLSSVFFNDTFGKPLSGENEHVVAAHKLLRPLAEGCSPISTLPCNALQVGLPFTLTFTAGITGTLADKNGIGTGFTTVNTYSGTRNPADGQAVDALVPGYAPGKITLAGGRIQLTAGKGIDYQANNNQINVLGVKTAAVKKLQIEVKLINPVNKEQAQQAGLWYGLHDKTFIKLGVTGNKVELRKERNDVTSTTAGTTNTDQRITAAVTGLNTKTVQLRMIIDSLAGTVEGFYSVDGGSTFINVGAAYPVTSLNIAPMGITGGVSYAAIFATYRNGTAPETYTFDDLAAKDITVTEPAPTFPPVNINFRPKGTAAPSGYTADNGLPFDAARKYGWISPATGLPVSLAANMRLRTGTADPRQLSHVEMQSTKAPEVPGTWEHAVPNGMYNVTVSVGDNNFYDSNHQINVEGVAAIDHFLSSSATKFKVATITIQVLDGKVTVDANGGVHTKMNYISISKADPTVTRATMTLKNMDLFPANDQLVFSFIQIPWRRTSPVVTEYNANHDKVTLRVNSAGTGRLTVSRLALSNSSAWKIVSINGDTNAGLPVMINPGAYADVTIQFIARNFTTRIKTFADTLSITSDDADTPVKKVMLRGIWQNRGEGNYEPYAQEIIDAFGFTSKTGYTSNDGTVKGKTIMPNSSEISASYFVKADNSKPIIVHQMAAYHGCCTPALIDTIKYILKGSTTVRPIFAHQYLDSQSLLPRLSGSSTAPGRGTFEPSGAFRLSVGTSTSDRTKNYNGLIGLRILKVVNSEGKVIPNAYFINTDYLGTSFTNYDYQDGIYYIENIKPETAAARESFAAADDELSTGKVLVYPNPSSGSEVNLTVSNFGVNEEITLTVTSILSEKILHTESFVTDSAGKAEMLLRITKNLDRGIYIVHAQSQSSSVHTRLLIE